MSLQWDPSPVAFSIPQIHLTIYWYGIFFALGLLLSILLAKHLLRQFVMKEIPEQEFQSLVDRLIIYSTIGIVFFARIFHVVFYDWNYFQEQPGHLLSFWEGGLASHGAFVGVILATWYFWKKQALASKYKIHSLQCLDCIALASFPAASCIRIGNFFNQEIVGTAYSGFFAVQFLHPLGNLLEPISRHPVQLYEAVGYTLIGTLLLLARKTLLKKKGLGLGLVLTSFFSLRFLLEYLKAPQTFEDYYSLFSMGQVLSLPVLLMGLFLIVRCVRTRSD